MIFGLLLAFSGAVITLADGDLTILFHEPVSRGDLFLLSCVLSWAVYSISVKHTMKRLSAMTVLTYSSVLGAFLLIPFVIWEGEMAAMGTTSMEIWISLLYLSIGAAVIAHLFYYAGIKAIGVSRSAIFLNLEPVAAISLGIIILGEQLTGTLLIGAVLVTSGLILSNLRRT